MLDFYIITIMENVKKYFLYKALLVLCVFAYANIGQSCRKGSNEGKLSEQPVPVTSPATGAIKQKSQSSLSLKDSRKGPAKEYTEREEASSQPQIDNKQKKLIKNGSVSIEVKSLKEALIQIKEITEQIGGYIESENIQRDSSDRYTGHIKIRVPSEKYDSLFQNFGNYGKVLAQSTYVDDITVDYYDTVLRLENKEDLRKRLKYLLETKTGKLKEVVAVETKIAEVTVEIESLKGKIRYYDKNVSMSSIDVNLNEPDSVIESVRMPFWKRILKGFVAAWDNFVDFIVFLISSLGIILPLLLLSYPVYRFYSLIKDKYKIKDSSKKKK